MIPPDASIELDDKTHGFGFVADFINKTILRDRQWGVTTEQLIVAIEIRTAFKGKNVGEQVTLSNDQWEKLCAVVKRPTDPYNPLVMIECGSFIDAVLKAK
jgi:hypothetical protein